MAKRLSGRRKSGLIHQRGYREEDLEKKMFSKIRPREEDLKNGFDKFEEPTNKSSSSNRAREESSKKSRVLNLPERLKGLIVFSRIKHGNA